MASGNTKGADPQTQSPQMAAADEAQAYFNQLEPGDLAPWWVFKGICDNWGLSPFVTEVLLQSVGQAVLFLVRQNERPYAVARLSASPHASTAVAVVSEITWMQALRAMDVVSIAEPLPTSSGFLTADIADERGIGWVCVCTRYAEGDLLSTVPNPAPHFRTVGRWAALIHRHSRRWQQPVGFQRLSWDVEDMVGPRARWGRWEQAELANDDAATLLQAQQEAKAVLANFPKTGETWGLVHAGLYPANILLGADLTLLDFGDCGYSWYLYDFAAALTFAEDEPQVPALAQAWMAGYCELDPQTDQQLDAACALSLLRRLQVLGRATAHPKTMPEGYQAQAYAAGSVRCARRYLQNPRWLLDD